MTPVFAQSFLHGQYDPDYQKNGLGGGIDGVLSEYFVCDRELFPHCLASGFCSELTKQLCEVEEGVVPMPKHLNYVEACTSVITVGLLPLSHHFQSETEPGDPLRRV